MRRSIKMNKNIFESLIYIAQLITSVYSRIVDIKRKAYAINNDFRKNIKKENDLFHLKVIFHSDSSFISRLPIQCKNKEQFNPTIILKRRAH